MGFYRPVGEWRACYCADGRGNCCECGQDTGLCGDCGGSLFVLDKVWVREPGDPPPLDASVWLNRFSDQVHKLAQERVAKFRP